MQDVPIWKHDDFFHAWWADAAGDLLAGEYPGQKADDEATRRKLSLLVAAGISTIVDLTHPSDRLTSYAEQAREVAAQQRVDLRLLSHPIVDVSVTTPEHYDQIVNDIEAEIAAGRKVFVHCWGGVGRTGTVVGIWHVRRGLGPDAALQRIAAAREGTRKDHRPAPETPGQVEAIRAAHARQRSAARSGGPQA
ncbi:MAG: fused DSP-PTPase phosphatase/NAD kinase-like protein [Planctomycetia bacterium]